MNQTMLYRGMSMRGTLRFGDRLMVEAVVLEDVRAGDVVVCRSPDDKGDSATFLSFLLPDESSARRAARKLTEAGVDGCFYYYDNNWHYYRCWHHLKALKTAATVPAALFDYCPDYAGLQLPDSDGIISRNISMQIKLSWTAAEVDRRIERMRKILSEI